MSCSIAKTMTRPRSSSHGFVIVLKNNECEEYQVLDTRQEKTRTWLKRTILLAAVTIRLIKSAIDALKLNPMSFR